MVETVTLISHTLAAAESGTTPDGVKFFAIGRIETLSLQFVLTRAGGGTTCKAYVQTSLDGGTTYFDIACCALATTTATRLVTLNNTSVTTLATPTDGSLADNTCVDGFLGSLYRVKLTTTGTYTGASSIVVTAVAK